MKQLHKTNWGASITVTNDENILFFINPNHDNVGIPSKEDTAMADEIIKRFNAYNALVWDVNNLAVDKEDLPENIEFFTRWLSDHNRIKKENYWLYMPFTHEHVLSKSNNPVGYATGSEMFLYWENNKSNLLPLMGVIRHKVTEPVLPKTREEYIKRRDEGLLQTEFDALTKKLFGTAMFAVFSDDDPDTKRYEQLLQYFHPRFRTSTYVSPL